MMIEGLRKSWLIFSDGFVVSRAVLFAKRLLDLTVASLGLLLAAPLMLLVALAVRLDSPGPVLFRQERLGRGSKPFTLWKFRSMRTDADDGPHREYVRDMIRGAERTNEQGTFKLHNDERVTRAVWMDKDVGRLAKAEKADVYAYVDPGVPFVGSDAIALGLMYKRETVAPKPGAHPAMLDDRRRGAPGSAAPGRGHQQGRLLGPHPAPPRVSALLRCLR